MSQNHSVNEQWRGSAESSGRNVLVTIVIPTYNEAVNIGKLIDSVIREMEKAGFKDEFEILVVDDDSPDGTCLVVRKKALEDKRVRCLLRRKSKGLATAILRGIHWARGRYVVVMDADFQHPPEVVPRLVRKALDTGADIVVATRYSSGGGVAGWSKLRLLMSKTAIFIAKVLVPGARSTSDPMSGFFLVRKDIVENAALNPRGYKILMEILERTNYSRVEEVPYVFRNRAGGKSKLGPKTIVDFLLHALQLSPLTRFAIVGALGAIVNLMVMAGLLLLGVNKYIASLAGIEAGILFNFPFHEHWTFKSKMGKGWFSRLVGYHLASIGGMVTTLGVMMLLSDVLSLTTPITAQAIGIMAGFAVNYGISQTKIWGRIRGELNTKRVSAAHRRDKDLY